MRLNQRRRGDCYYNNNIGATRAQGIWAFSWLSSGCLYHRIILNEGRAYPGITPGTPPLDALTNTRLIFVITRYGIRGSTAQTTSTAPDASQKSRPC